MKVNIEIEVCMKNNELTIQDQKGDNLIFSEGQIVQKKVIMVLVGELSDKPKKEVTEAFGYKTRKSYYDAQNEVFSDQPEALLPKKRGPNKPFKRTPEVEKKIIQMRFETPYNMYEIAEELRKEGIDVSSRLVGQILTDYGLSKKKR